MEDITQNESLHFDARVDMSSVHDKLQEVRQEIGKVIVGQERMLDLLLVSMLANGHVLLEGVPGVAKTITAKIRLRIQEGADFFQYHTDRRDQPRTR